MSIMSRKHVVRLLFVLLLPMLGCSKTTIAPGTPVLVGTPPVFFWTTYASAQKLYPQPPEYVTVDPTPAKIPPRVQDSQGNCYEQVEGVAAMVQVSSCTGYHIIPSGERVLFFQNMFGSDGALGKSSTHDIYQMPGKDVFTLVGKADAAYTALPNGASDVMMRAENSNDPWLAHSEGKLYARNEAGVVEQAGWCEYLHISDGAKGNKALLLMSKGMGKNDKWIGTINGRLYIEK